MEKDSIHQPFYKCNSTRKYDKRTMVKTMKISFKQLITYIFHCLEEPSLVSFRMEDATILARSNFPAHFIVNKPHPVLYCRNCAITKKNIFSKTSIFVVPSQTNTRKTMVFQTKKI